MITDEHIILMSQINLRNDELICWHNSVNWNVFLP